MDKSEAAILRELQVHGRITNVELAQRIGSSEAPCFRRVKALEESGYIQGYSARLDKRKLGYQVTALVLVALDQQSDAKVSKFKDAVEGEEHIIECHAISGSHDYFLKVIARNIDHFSELSMKHILKFPGVRSIESNFSLMAVKEESPLPIDL
ncbi:MAG: Lrp/AsnC family transcriptional regulator [Pseudomonadota bacterium]